jgi:hypothetical protein
MLRDHVLSMMKYLILIPIDFLTILFKFKFTKVYVCSQTKSRPVTSRKGKKDLRSNLNQPVTNGET